MIILLFELPVKVPQKIVALLYPNLLLLLVIMILLHVHLLLSCLCLLLLILLLYDPWRNALSLLKAFAGVLMHNVLCLVIAMTILEVLDEVTIRLFMKGLAYPKVGYLPRWWKNPRNLYDHQHDHHPYQDHDYHL
jgi:hypothetical protein